MIEALARKYGVDLIMNAVDPVHNEKIFDAAFNVGANYIDMAMTLSSPHPQDPFHKPHIKLGDYQFERARQWEEKGLLALVGLGVEPGVADVFARYAQDHLFDEIDEIGIRDGANLVIAG
jgi:saccharopine dehydrogenase-like NADP-dependent oxidoreductase